MTSKGHRIIGASASVVVLLSVIAWFVWLPIKTWFVVKQGTQFFHDNFQPTDDLHVVIHEDAWAALYFAGTKGLPEIKRLSQDPSLIPSGRRTASNLYVHVSTGGHLPSVRWSLEKGGLPWLWRRYYSYILRQDTKYLRARGLPVPEGTNP